MPTPFPPNCFVVEDVDFNAGPINRILDICDVRELMVTVRQLYYDYGAPCSDLAELISSQFAPNIVYAMPGTTMTIDQLALNISGVNNGNWPIFATARRRYNSSTSSVSVGDLRAVIAGGVLTGFTGSNILVWPDDSEYDTEELLPVPGWKARIENSRFPALGLKGIHRVVTGVTNDFLTLCVPECVYGPEPEPSGIVPIIENLIGIQNANYNPPSLPTNRYPRNLK